MLSESAEAGFRFTTSFRADGRTHQRTDPRDADADPPSKQVIHDIRAHLLCRWKFGVSEEATFPQVCLHATNRQHQEWIDEVCQSVVGRKATAAEVVQLSIPAFYSPFDALLWRTILRRCHDPKRITVSGVVKGADEQPIEEALVVEMGSGSHTTTDAAGRFTMKLRAPGSSRYSFDRNQFDFQASKGGFSIGLKTINAGNEQALTDVLIVLEPHDDLIGEVVDHEGRPLGSVGVHICKFTTNGQVIQTAFTDSSGRYSLSCFSGPNDKGALANVSLLLFTHPEFMHASQFGPSVGDGRVVLERGGEGNGVVRDRRGNPVPLGYVQLRPYDHTQRTTTYADSEGGFKLHGKEGKHRLVAHSPKHALVWQDVDVAVANPVANAVVELDEGEWISGGIFDENGAPLAAAAVSCLDRARVQSAESNVQDPLYRELHTASDDEGRFRIGPVVAGEQYKVTAFAAATDGDRGRWAATIAKAGDEQVGLGVKPLPLR